MTAGNEETQGDGADDDFDTVAVPMRGPTSGNEEVRRGSPYVSPALRSSLASPSSRESTPNRHRVTIESLLRRPRSNPRTRTPMRYESPLSPNAFRRDEASPERREGQRITVRPLAGAAVGTARGSRRIREMREGRPVTPLSSKQGPSRRKVRRWNNDNFSGIASELAKASARGAAAAEVLLKAQADAPLYVSVYNPNDCPESTVSKFMVTDDVKMMSIRDDFFQGAPNSHTRTKKTTTVDVDLTPEQMLKRIPERLRNVVIRACSSSEATAKLVGAYERFLVDSFAEGKAAPLGRDIAGSLLEAPTVTQTKSGSTVARFSFDSESSAGGFQRLLLHAVCQFHSLHAVSKTVEMETRSERLLTVTGTLLGSKVRLSQVIHDKNKQHADVSHATESLSSLRL